MSNVSAFKRAVDCIKPGASGSDVAELLAGRPRRQEAIHWLSGKRKPPRWAVDLLRQNWETRDETARADFSRRNGFPGPRPLWVRGSFFLFQSKTRFPARPLARQRKPAHVPGPVRRAVPRDAIPPRSRGATPYRTGPMPLGRGLAGGCWLSWPCFHVTGMSGIRNRAVCQVGVQAGALPS